MENIQRRKVSILMKSILFVGAITLIATNLTSCNKAYDREVTLKSECLELVGDSIAKSNTNYTCSFKIKDDVISSRYMDNIDVDTLSVSVNGKDLPVDAFSFIYQTNARNTFTIQKQYLTGNIEIKADLTKRTQKHNCFFFEYDIDDYTNFSDATFKVSSKGQVSVIKQGETQKLLEAFDVLHEHFSMDDLYLKDGYDMAVVEKGSYAIKVESVVVYTFTLQHNMFFVREDNAFEVSVKSKDDKALPKNIWLRSNARYTKKDEDFTIVYSNDYKNATIKVPYFFIRDNGSIRLNPDVEK